MMAVKFVTCEKHNLKVWHPAGLKCPACHPEAYPVEDLERPGADFWLHPVSHSQPGSPGKQQPPGRMVVASQRLTVL